MMYVNKHVRTSESTHLQQLLQNDLYQSLFDHSCDAIWAVDLEGSIILMNGASRTLLPFKMDFYLYKNITRCISFEDESGFFNTLSSNETHRFTGILVNEASPAIRLEINSIPIITHDEVVGRFIQTKDRTEHFEEFEQLKSENAYWESFINHSADAIGLFDKDGNIVKLNRATEDIFLYTREELLGNKVVTIPDESYRKEVEFLQRKVKSGKSVVEYETVRKRKDGELIDVTITYSPIFDQNGKMIAMANILRDITERKQAIMELKESEAKYRLIAENTGDMIRVMDLNGNIIFASPSHQSILGRAEEYYLDGDGFHFVHQDDYPIVKQHYQEMLSTKSPVNFEYKELHKDGSWVTLEAHCTPVINHMDEISSIVLVVRDLTERKQTEELLRNSDKLAVIGQMAASIAHEIRNPLTSLKGFLQFFYSHSDEASKHYYELMLSELERINLIVSEFLLLAKPQKPDFTETSIEQLFAHLLTLVDSQAIMENVEITTDFEERLPSLRCDENQLKQAFLNFIKNGIEAASPGGRLDIRVKKEADNICIQIEDDGCGIPEENLEKIGTPFFSTKNTGTGLGLMISQKIITHHRGTVEFASENQNGTIVMVKLPISHQSN